MRCSTQVVAPLLASAAVAILAGCHHQEMQRCVDENNKVVDPQFCQNLPLGAQATPDGRGYYDSNHTFFPFMYHYYYGGSGSRAFGSTVTGGSLTPSAGHSYSMGSGTSRGGFGSSFGSSSHGFSSGS